MATYTVTNKQLLDNFAVVQLLVPFDGEIGSTITVSGVGVPFNGTFVVRDLPQYEFIGIDDQGELLYNGSNPIANQILYPCTGADVDLVAASGTVTYTPVCTWITGQQIADWLNILYASDQTFLDQCASAANQFCWRRRQESGKLQDSLTTVPSGDVALGTIMYGGALYRQRGSIDAFASFSEMGGTAPVVGLSPIIKQLLEIGAHAVA